LNPGPETVGVKRKATAMAKMSKAERDARRWLANERAYAAVPTPDGAPDRIAKLESIEALRRQKLTAELLVK
jgi:hypothetical protein